MTLRRPLEFDHDDRKSIYEYVEEHGAVDPDVAQTDCLPHDAGGFRHHVAILRRNGYLARTDDGHLEVAVDSDETEEEYDREDLSFRVRPARQADLTGIVGAMRQVVEDGRYIVAESVAQEVDHDQALLRHNEIESRMFFVATVDDEVVGWVHLRSPELEKLAHTAELTLGVLEEYRGNGIGSHLLQRGLQWAASRGYEKVYQSLPATNEEAIAFLEEHGWAIEAVREDHYVIDGEYVDETMLAVEL
ncbi:N-acetyltransferase GCN5 [Salinarchaeum sp. Harcht-Bsk1]|uniref:GNAT family N-acetyltransferase n=1 Tax=Salinarchaeum sp. Harcht-Bsk1 TaxID=1333523 RepID=UPI00034237CE|nr:GNAT family N-acetyltransferase [Salinarchaeum sp. Harcht-Bsk1]AGN01483.1 N-acetyltransferase GCN5 [Salinarchaeum sp. Harcht-Bsk1]